MIKKKNIGTLLREYGLISDQDLEEGLAFQNQSGIRLGEALVRLGKVTSEDIDWILSKQLDISFVIVDELSIDKELAGRFPREFLIKNRMLPMYENDEEIAIVTDDPFNNEAFEILESLTQKRLKLSSGSGRYIEEVLRKSLRKVGIPSLVSHIQEVVRKIEKTSFYRIDFLLSGQRSEINVFGFGIRRPVLSLKNGFGAEEVFRAFDVIGVPFLYEEFTSGNATFLSILPLVGDPAPCQMPAVLGRYGLLLPELPAFTDLKSSGIPDVFHSHEPVFGYPYIASKETTSASGRIIYTIDSVPRDFENYHVKAYIPEKCADCLGAGCERCGDLGHRFSFLDGVYSYRDLQELLKRS